MSALILGMLTDFPSGAAKRWINAVEAFEAPPLNSTAKRWATLALILFCMASMLIAAAALVECFAGNRFASELLGWSGILAFQFFIVCGIQYAAVNNLIECSPPE